MSKPKIAEAEPSTTPSEEDFNDLLSVAPPAAAPADEDKEEDSPSDANESDEGQADEKKADSGDSDAKQKAEPAPAAEPKQEDKQELFLGKFKLTGDREKDLAVIGDAYKNLESLVGQKSTALRRAEDLLTEAIKRAPSQVEDKPAAPKEKSRKVVELIAKAALEDEGIDDDAIAEQLTEALLDKLLTHPKVNETMYAAIRGVRTEEDTTSTLRSKFFEANPELTDIPDWAMHKIAQEEQERILNSPDALAMTPAEFTQKVLETTAERARTVFGRAKTEPKTGAKPVVKKQPTGTRSEGGSPRRGDPAPLLTDTQKDMEDLL